MAQEVMLSAFKDDRNAELKPWSSNPTYLPDSLLEVAQVVILIRHPAKIVSSGAPVARDAIGLQPGDRDIFNMFTLRWARLMFDYLRSTGKDPIVVSGEDVVGNPGALLDALSEALGVARGGLRVSWPLVSPEERPTGPMGPWLKRVSGSTGVERKAEQVCQHRDCAGLVGTLTHRRMSPQALTLTQKCESG
jgi:hypothetical protein